jgi:hypothetical protein
MLKSTSSYRHIEFKTSATLHVPTPSITQLSQPCFMMELQQSIQWLILGENRPSEAGSVPKSPSTSVPFAKGRKTF